LHQGNNFRLFDEYDQVVNAALGRNVAGILINK
jgi:hypothetical protein